MFSKTGENFTFKNNVEFLEFYGFSLRFRTFQAKKKFKIFFLTRLIEKFRPITNSHSFFGHTFCVIHFCVIHPIFKETHEVMQSVIQNFAWYKVSYLQWNKVSYYFFSDVEWHTIAEILYLQEQEYLAPPVNLFFLLQTPTTWLFKDFLVPRSQTFEFMSRPVPFGTTRA